MKRILLILDGTEHLDTAMTEVKHLCDAGDKLTVLSVAETPASELLGTEPGHIIPEPYVGPAGAVGARSGREVPVFESENDTETRVAGELRDALDDQIGANGDDLEVWTQAIVRDKPAEAVANYMRQSDFEEVAVPRHSLDRLRELLTDEDGQDALDGSLAPVIVLPA